MAISIYLLVTKQLRGNEEEANTFNTNCCLPSNMVRIRQAVLSTLAVACTAAAGSIKDVEHIVLFMQVCITIGKRLSTFQGNPMDLRIYACPPIFMFHLRYVLTLHVNAL